MSALYPYSGICNFAHPFNLISYFLTPDTLMQEQDEICVSWLQPGLTQAVTEIWRVRQQMEKFLSTPHPPIPLSIPVCM